MISLLGVWRAHGIDAILREAWEAGVILCGLSAGSLCWFAEAVTGFHGAPKRLEGLGLLPFSNCVHYEPGSKRRESYHRFLREGMRPGYAAEDGAALHFTGEELSRVISSRPGGARLPARRRRPARGRDADRHHLPRRTRGRPRRTAAGGALHHGRGLMGPPGSSGEGGSAPPAPATPCAASSPSAATTSPRARPTAPSASCCCGWPASAAPSGRGSASCRPRAATPPSRSAASTPPSASAPASPPTSPSSGSAGGRWRCATTCSPRT